MNNEPFIHLYRSPRGFYFYEVNKDSIVGIDKSLYDYLDKKKSDADLGADEQKSLQFLKDKGYLSAKHFTNVKHPETDNMKYYLDNKCNQLILQVTQACNLICYYCPYANKSVNSLQRDHSGKTMTWEVAKASIDFFFSHSSDSDELAFSFYGGEPLIAFDLIKKCVAYTDELFVDKKHTYSMTTNATLFDDEMIEFLVAHNFDITFSIDGPEHIHDINRKKSDGTGSFRTAFQNLKKVADKYGEKAKKHIMINTVINPEHDLDEILSLYKEPFFEKYRILMAGAMAEDDMLDKNIEATDDYRWKITYQYFLGLLDYLDLVKDIDVPLFIKVETHLLTNKYELFRSPGEGLPDEGAPGGPCIPGQQRLFVDTSGTLYPCEKVNETAGCMQIGNVFDGFDYEKADSILNISRITAEKCRNCYALLHCQLCARYADAGDHFSAEKRIANCDNSYSYVDDLIQSCILIKESRTMYKWRG